MLAHVAIGQALCYTTHMSRLVGSLPGKMLTFAGLAVWLTVAAVACATIPPAGPYHVGQIIDPATRATVSYAEFGSRLQAADVIYIGEAHYTPSHVAAAIQVLQTVLDGGRTPVVGMEMFSWDGQEGIDRYLNGTVTSTEDFVAESRWQHNWGGDYGDYAPLVDFVKAHGLQLLGLNPPRSLVRTVARKGLSDMTVDPTMHRWPVPTIQFPVDDPEYRRVIYEQIKQCHEGLSEEVYEKIYEASVFRDEGMASVVTAVVGDDAREPGPFVSYTGAGHIQYGLPVPKRVQRQSGGSLTHVTVYLHALDPEHEEDVVRLLKEPVADYVWLTALGPQGRPPRCGESSHARRKIFFMKEGKHG
ncbi:MAG: ChaN family lipoprotein [Nitrospira sp.]|nr:ChaN family lipoprotein [Nitrospira sp.]